MRTGVLATRENVDLFGADVVKCMGSREKEEEIARLKEALTKAGVLI